MKKIFVGIFAVCFVPLILAAAGPWDAWRKGYNAFEKGARLKESGEYQRARAAFREAVMHYEAVRKARPDWNQRVIQSRISESRKAIREIDQLLTSSQLSGASGVSTPEINRLPTPDTARPAVPVSAREAEKPLPPAKPSEPMVTQAEYDRLALESERYRKRLLEALVELEDLRRELARNKARSEEIGNLLRERRVAEERYTLLQKRYTELENQLKKPNSKISELESKLLELQLSLDLEKKRVVSLEAKWRKADEEALRQAGLFRAANERVSAAQQEIEKLTAAAAELRRARDAAADLNGQRENALARNAAELREKEQTIKTLQTEIRQFQQTIDELRRGVVSQEGVARNLIEENQKLRSAVSKNAAEKSASAGQLNQQTARIRDLQQEILQLREKAQQAAAQLERAAADLSAARKDLDRERAAAKFTHAEIANWRERCTKLENDVKTWSERAAVFEKRVNNITANNLNALDAADREKKRLENEITTLTERFAVLQARSEQLEGLRKQSETLRAQEHQQLTVLTKKLRTTEDTASRNSAALTALKQKELKQRQELQTQLQNLRKQTLEIRSLQQTIASLKQDAETLRTRQQQAIEALKQDAESARIRQQQAIEALKQEAETASARQQQTIAALKQAKTANSQQQQTITALKQEAETARVRQQQAIEALKREAETASARQQQTIEALKQEAETANSRQQQAITALKQETKTVHSQQQQGSVLQQRLEATNRRLQEVSVNFQALRKENASLKAQAQELNRLRGEIAAAQKQAGSLSAVQKNVLALQQENQALRDRVMAAQNQLQSLKQQLLASRNAVPPTVAGTTTRSPAPKRAVSGSVKDLIAAGIKAEKEEKYALAVWNYETVLELDPAHAEGAMRLGLVQLRRQLFEQAEKNLALARSAGMNDPAVRIAHAQALNGLQKYGNALEVLAPLLKNNAAPSAELVLPAAAANLGAGKYAQAETLLRGAIARNPERAALKKELARILVRTNRSNEALELYRRAKELGETPDRELENALGKLFEERRELNNFMADAAREAEKNQDWISAAWYYRQMLDQEKNSAVLAAHLAFAQLQSKNPAAAIETLTMNPPSAVGMLIRALAHYRNGDAVNTVKDAKAVLSLNHVKPLVLEVPEWQMLKEALKQAVAKPAPKMTGAVQALKSVFR